MINIIGAILKKIGTVIGGKIHKIMFDAKWRRINSHNETIVIGTFPMDKVTVGKGTYGPLHVRSWGNDTEKLTIGNYCSIGDGVSFLLGGNHRMDTFMSFPIKVKLIKSEEQEAFTKGPIVVKDDVWIGADVVILSGVTIGQGSVIGVGSVVAKDVEPYSIVVGNPAQTVKKRFSNEIIQALLKENFSGYTFKNLNASNIDQVYKTISSVEDVNNVAEFFK